jgi:hypothetical protein
MIMIQYAVMAILFLLELSALVAFSYWGFHLDKGSLLKMVFGIGTPLFFAFIWGMFIAPKATIPVNVPIRILLKLIVFGLAAVSLYVTGKHILAVVFIVVTIIILVLANVLKV